MNLALATIATVFGVVGLGSAQYSAGNDSCAEGGEVLLGVGKRVVGAFHSCGGRQHNNFGAAAQGQELRIKTNTAGLPFAAANHC
jgi:hypothetical protein